jgi:hypothetical protein
MPLAPNSTSINQQGSSPAVPGVGSTGSMYFPKDLSKQPFWISFSFYQYQMPDLIKQDVYYNDQGTIRLPLPNTMTDSQHVEYSAESLSLSQATSVAGAKAIGGPNGSAGGVLAGLGIGAASGALSQAAGALGGGGAQALYDGAKGVGAPVLQTAGMALNPFLSVMFKSPAFKQHSLSWKLSPSNEKESQTLNSIINTFRMNMLPNQSGALAGTLLTYPNIVQTTISVNNGQYFTYAFKPAVIQNMDINFAPSGQPSFFGNTKAPTEIEIRLQLMEIEYWLASDYGLQDNSLATKISEAVNSALNTVGQTATKFVNEVNSKNTLSATEIAAAGGGG